MNKSSKVHFLGDCAVAYKQINFIYGLSTLAIAISLLEAIRINPGHDLVDLTIVAWTVLLLATPFLSAIYFCADRSNNWRYGAFLVLSLTSLGLCWAVVDTCILKDYEFHIDHAASLVISLISATVALLVLLIDFDN